MAGQVLKVPRALLLSQELTATAKLVWMLLRSQGAETAHARLAACSGLSRPTVLQGIAQLKAAGWLGAAPPPWQGASWVPFDLLLDTRLRAQARLMYGVLRSTGTAGQCSYAELVSLTGLSPNTVKLAVRELREWGWLTLEQSSKFSPISFALRVPAPGTPELSITRVRRRLKRAPFRGEALMRAFLTLHVDSDEFEDDASPGFLLNPFTGEHMHYDRYYPPGVAFEFQGPQHDGPTEKYPDEEEAQKQQARDYIKRGISAARGITLVEVRSGDLTLEGMRRKVAGLLPPRDLTGLESLIAYLEAESRTYREKAEPSTKSR